MTDVARTALLAQFRENEHLCLINFEVRPWNARDPTRQYTSFGLTYLPEEVDSVVEIITKEAMMPSVREMQQREVVYLDFRQYQEFYTFTLSYVR